MDNGRLGRGTQQRDGRRPAPRRAGADGAFDRCLGAKDRIRAYALHLAQYIILNLGISSSFQTINWAELEFPATMVSFVSVAPVRDLILKLPSRPQLVDYVRVRWTPVDARSLALADLISSPTGLPT